MKSFNSINRNKGFTLIEILLVIGIIAILAIAAFVIFPQVQASSRANNEQNNIATIAAGVKNLYGSAGKYDGVTNDVINVARIFPASMNGGSNATGVSIKSSWDGAVSVLPVGAAAPYKNFSITYSAVPAAVCTKLVPAIAANFDKVSVGTGATPTVVKDVTVPATATLDVAGMVTACGAATAPDITLVSN
jgi:prepilin-type N-terminal cleavage/methylation domain-containing protein